MAQRIESLPIIPDRIPFRLFLNDSGCYAFWYFRHVGLFVQTVRNRGEAARSKTVRLQRQRQWAKRVRKATWAAGTNPPFSIPLAEEVLRASTSMTNSVSVSQPRTCRTASRRAG